MSGPASLFLFAVSAFARSCLLAVSVPYMAPVARDFGIEIRSPLRTQTHASEKYTRYTVVSSCTLQQFNGLQNYYFLMILSFNKIGVLNPKSLIRVVYSMTKLPISHTTISQLTTNSTKYYQLTNYYVDKTKLLFIHQTTTFWYFTFHSSTLQLFIKLLLSYSETTISS